MRHAIVITILLVSACDENKPSKAHSSDPCLAIAEHAIGDCMATRGNGAVDEERVRFCTDQYVAIVRVCRCEPEAEAPKSSELPEVP